MRQRSLQDFNIKNNMKDVAILGDYKDYSRRPSSITLKNCTSNLPLRTVIHASNLLSMAYHAMPPAYMAASVHALANLAPRRSNTEADGNATGAANVALSDPESSPAAVTHRAPPPAYLPSDTTPNDLEAAASAIRDEPSRDAATSSHDEPFAATTLVEQNPGHFGGRLAQYHRLAVQFNDCNDRIARYNYHYARYNEQTATMTTTPTTTTTTPTAPPRVWTRVDLTRTRSKGPDGRIREPAAAAAAAETAPRLPSLKKIRKIDL